MRVRDANSKAASDFRSIPRRFSALPFADAAEVNLLVLVSVRVSIHPRGYARSASVIGMQMVFSHGDPAVIFSLTLPS